MSIVGQRVVESRRYNGWEDPRYPIGFWQAALTVTGDASGGVLGVDLVFQTANGPQRLNSQMYSVERFTITIAAGANRDVRILANNMGGPENQGFKNEYAVFVEDLAGVGASALMAHMLVLCPWFLGSQRTAGQTASLSIVLDNPDTVAVDFEAEGYRWSPRSVLVDGGPQRPPTGLYRQ